MPIRAVIFDFDYTLADASDGIVDCVSHALRQLRLPPASPGDIRSTIGLSLPRTFEALAAAEQRGEHTPEDFTACFLERAEEVMVKKTRVYPGTRGTVEAVRARGCATAIASSKYRRRIEAVLALHDLSHLFDYVVGGEDVPKGEEKPSPTPLRLAVGGLGVASLRPEECLMVGDHTVDVQAARAAGMQHITVLTGEATAETFVEAGLGDAPRIEQLTDLVGYLAALEAGAGQDSGSRL